VARAASATVKVSRPAPNAVMTVSPRASDSTNSRPMTCFDVPVQVAVPDCGSVEGAGVWRSVSSISATVRRSLRRAASRNDATSWRLV